MVSTLAKYGIDIDAMNDEMETALHCCCRHGHAESMQILADAGADVNAANKAGYSPLHIAS